MPDGSRPDGPAGRLVNPGHSIESARFLLEVGSQRGDSTLIERAAGIIDRSLDIGWDNLHDGILYFVDVEGRPVEQLEWDMKLWWPHAEALYALLLAWKLTGNADYGKWYGRVHSYVFSHFPDPEYGEWFGYLHRDGSVALDFKGSVWKGAFHT